MANLNTKVLAILITLVVVLALTSTFFYDQYENQVSARSRESQLELEDGVPRATVLNCVTEDFRNHDPSVSDFTPLLPKSLGNATAGSVTLVDAWPVPINNSTFQVYEVWNVGYALNGDYLHLLYTEILYSVNCTNGSS